MQALLTKIKIFMGDQSKQQLLANLAMLITVLFWGISFISIKIAVSEVPPITMALIRFIIASAILLVIIRKLEPASKLKKEDRIKMLTAGFLGITLYFYFENSGVKMTTASNASLITSITPIIAIALDMIIFKTKPSVLKFVGMGCAVAGAYLAVTANGQLSFNSATFKGNLFMVFAMLTWSLYTLLNKALQDKYSGLFLTTCQTLFGTILLVPASFIEYRQWHLFSFTAFSNILFLAVCCSAICYFLYIFALKRLDVAITTLYLNLTPVVGVVSGYLVLRETVLPVQLLGGLMIIVVIIAINLEKQKSTLKSAGGNPECAKTV
ncbi:putative inner membrane transporter yiJE [Pelotomaculum schinkii]|uniref:Putative inner membrane transporter yiJE n=1 Tax=Pelotomaculum schinkii TaxID=78350 RepID=A0A4Y7RFW1_9FIRM|nr:DMT family transporter [Pelotomaculum schinkii]TEB07686.1 putative inner membrane transporter yiJE [Pelotomaculum schinkii]